MIHQGKVKYHLISSMILYISRYKVCKEIDKFISIFKAWRHIFESFFPFIIIQDSSLKTEGPALNSEQQH